MKKAKNQKKHHLVTRTNILFFFVFLLFSALILRLGYVQIVSGEDYSSQLASTSKATSTIDDAPRGFMYDRYGNIVVDNKLKFSVTYTNPSQSTSANAILEVAEKLEPFIEMDTSGNLERDKRDYILLNMSEEERYDLVSKEERAALETISEEYQLEIERVTDEQIEALSEKDEKIIAIFSQMVRGYANTPQRIKQNLTDEEVHTISEHLDQLPGIDILRDSTRYYPYDQSFKSIFGSVNSIPSEKIDYYLSRGYKRSDLVGTSYLEAQYEDVLRGQKATVESITERKGANSVDRSIEERLGQRGYDLVLTIDMELQQKLEEIIDRRISESRGSFINGRIAYAVLMDPRTGDILAMAGFNDAVNSYADHIGNVNMQFEMGSSIKAASVLTGFEAGVVQPGTQLHDRPIKLPNTPPKKSWRTMGWVDDRKALEQSSNVYMYEIAMKMAGCHYQGPNQGCGWNSDSVAKAYDEIRNNFRQFGLGSQVGIDLPSYSSGLEGGKTEHGKLLDFMIGQYDNYTPLQLAQYIATIANDGYRMEPRLVREIRDSQTAKGELGPVIQKFEPTVLNRVEMKDEYIKRVQQGLRDVMTRGTASSMFGSEPYQPAGKTGTAQVTVNFPDGRSVSGNTQSLVGYAPFDNPEIAFAVVVPNVYVGGAPPMAQLISKDALNAYFDLKKERNGPTEVKQDE